VDTFSGSGLVSLQIQTWAEHELWFVHRCTCSGYLLAGTGDRLLRTPSLQDAVISTAAPLSDGSPSPTSDREDRGRPPSSLHICHIYTFQGSRSTRPGKWVHHLAAGLRYRDSKRVQRHSIKHRSRIDSLDNSALLLMFRLGQGSIRSGRSASGHCQECSQDLHVVHARDKSRSGFPDWSPAP